MSTGRTRRPRPDPDDDELAIYGRYIEPDPGSGGDGRGPEEDTEAPSRREPARGRPPSERRPRRERPPRRRSSDLLGRVLVAVPAAILAIGFVDVGGLAFALLLLVISVLCLHELYRMLSRWRPVPVAGYAAAAAMVLGAYFGTERTVVEIAMIATSMPSASPSTVLLGEIAGASGRRPNRRPPK